MASSRSLERFSFFLVAVLAAGGSVRGAGNEGQLEIRVVDKDTGKSVPCRMHLKTAAGRPKLPPRRVPVWDDHFIIPGSITLKLPLGNYTFEMERGPEYSVRTGQFTINRFAEDSTVLDLHRYVDMAEEGWWSGDLDVRRSPKEIELLMSAEDLHVVPLVTWWNGGSEWTAATLPKEPLLRFDENRYCHLLGGQQDYPGGVLHYFNLAQPLRLGPADRDWPPIWKFLQQARRQPGGWVDLSRPFWWDLPALVAHSQVDSIQVAHGNLRRKGVLADEDGGKPRDSKLLVGGRGHALWSQDIYFHLLNCGLRLPPSAGSGSGMTPNPVGYDRMYVHVDGDFSYAKWWEGLKAGRVTITNGPLMRPTVQGQFPGHVFHAPAGKSIEFEIGLTLTTREPMSYLEIIKDGRVEHEIRFDQYAKSGRLPKVRFDRSGWFTVRAVADLANNFRFAMSAPYYVEIGYDRRISKRSAQFFFDWVIERARQIRLDDPDQKREVLDYHRQARDYWQQLVETANAE